MADLAKQERVALDRLATLDDPARIRALIVNARRQKSANVERAAFARLCAVLPSEKPGSVEHDVWQSIFALEEMLKEERGKTVLLSRTRQKINRDGERKTVADLALKVEPSNGFHQLIDRGHPELLFEAVVLRHPDQFDEDVVDAARNRLTGAGVDPNTLAAPNGG